MAERSRGVREWIHCIVQDRNGAVRIAGVFQLSICVSSPSRQD